MLKSLRVCLPLARTIAPPPAVRQVAGVIAGVDCFVWTDGGFDASGLCITDSHRRTLQSH
jgi:hypothetical protein